MNRSGDAFNEYIPVRVLLEMDDATVWVDGLRQCDIFNDWKIQSFGATCLGIVYIINHRIDIASDFTEKDHRKFGLEISQKIDGSLCRILRRSLGKIDYPIHRIEFLDLDEWLTCDREWLRVMSARLVAVEENINLNLQEVFA